MLTTDAERPSTTDRLVGWYQELIDANRLLYAEHPSQRYLDEIATCERRISVLTYGGQRSLAALLEGVEP